VIVDDLLSRRLVILSGKGGVGKSTVGAALALSAQRRGKRVLLVEVDSPLGAARILGVTAPPGKESEPRPGLFTLNLNPYRVMDEYVRHVVKLELLARRILESPVYHRFFAAAPGLKELMLLGKILVLEEQRERLSRRPRYDVILLDAPATGHGLSLLKVPQAASAAIPVGPVGHQARRILAFLRDPKRTALGIVAVPEEMAVVEAIELNRMAVEQVGIEPRALFLNACHERRFSEDDEREVLRLGAEGAEGQLERGVSLTAALSAARHHIRRCKLTRFYQTRLRRSLPLPLVTLPYLFGDQVSAEGLDVLAERIEAA
jgi:anion-transporting  ArsA/GET3 family ATPase